MKSHWSNLFSPIFFVTILFLAVMKYISFHTSLWDLGWQDHVVFNIIRDHQWRFLFYGHAHLFGLFYGFLYEFIPSPILLITCQTLAITLAGLFITQKWPKAVEYNSHQAQIINYQLQAILIVLYFLYFPVWYNCLFDFHFEHLFVLFSAMFYWVVIYNSPSVPRLQKHQPATNYQLPTKIAVFFICLLCCLVKEVFALSAVMMGVYVIIRKRWWITGSLIVICSLLYFVFVEYYAIPYFLAGKDSASIWQEAFGYLGSNMKEILLNLLTHPWLIITEFFSDWGKVFYFIAIFGPFLFIPLLSPLELLPALPQFFISILSHSPKHYTISHQYTAGLIVPVFMAFIMGLSKADKLVNSLWLFISGKRETTINYQPQNHKLLTGILMSSLLFHILLSPSPISQMFWRNKVWSYGWQAYIPTKRNKMIKEAIKKYIPADPNVVVSTQNSLNWSYLAHRKYYFCFPTGVTEPAKVPDFSNKGLRQFLKYITNHKLQTPNYKLIYADYVLLDLKRLWFIKDMGCNKWKDGQCYDQTFSKKFLNLIKETKKKYSLIYEKDGFMIFHRLVSKKTSVFN